MGKVKVFFIDIIDVLVCYGKCILLKSFGWVLIILVCYFVIKSVGKEIVKVVVVFVKLFV